MGVIYFHVAIDQRRLERLLLCRTDYKRCYAVGSSVRFSKPQWIVDSDKAAPTIHYALINDPGATPDQIKQRSAMIFEAKSIIETGSTDLPNIRLRNEYSGILSSITDVTETLFENYCGRMRRAGYKVYGADYLWENFLMIKKLYERAYDECMPAKICSSDDFDMPRVRNGA